MMMMMIRSVSQCLSDATLGVLRRNLIWGTSGSPCSNVKPPMIPNCNHSRFSRQREIHPAHCAVACCGLQNCSSSMVEIRLPRSRQPADAIRIYRVFKSFFTCFLSIFQFTFTKGQSSVPGLGL